ncbi:MAG: hypothetical protein WCK02_11855 [Bacteroidota bacterium]
MKKIFVYSLILISIVSFSCKKDAETATSTTTAPVPTPSPYYFNCKINGVDWVAVTPNGHDSASVAIPGETEFVLIDKSKTTLNSLAINFISIPSNNTQWTMLEAIYNDNNYNTYSENLHAVQYTISRDSATRIAQGTFSCNVINFFDENDTLKITNGAFKVKF